MIVSSLARVLADPQPVLPEERVGARRPALVSDLPCLAVGLSFEQAPRAPATRFVREGDRPTEIRTSVVVSPASRGFRPELTDYSLEPLPLIRPPRSGTPELVVTNVSNASVPRPLRRVAAPSSADEYRLDYPRGRLVFGAPLTAGDTLEIVHWTMSWREPFSTEAFEGALELELWASAADELASIGGLLEARLAASRERRQEGFLRLVARRVETAESVRQSSGLAADFPAWRQRLAYQFAYEGISGGSETAGDRIRRIDVAVDDATPDRFHIGE